MRHLLRVGALASPGSCTQQYSLHRQPSASLHIFSSIRRKKMLYLLRVDALASPGSCAQQRLLPKRPFAVDPLGLLPHLSTTLLLVMQKLPLHRTAVHKQQQSNNSRNCAQQHLMPRQPFVVHTAGLLPHLSTTLWLVMQKLPLHRTAVHS